MQSVQGQLEATVAGSCERGTGKTLCCLSRALFEVNLLSPPLLLQSGVQNHGGDPKMQACPGENLRMRCSELFTPDEDQLQVSGVYLATKRLSGSQVV